MTGPASIREVDASALPTEFDESVVLLDVRTERSRDTSDFQAKGSVRMPPEHVVAQANQLKLPKEAWLIAYCA